MTLESSKFVENNKKKDILNENDPFWGELDREEIKLINWLGDQVVKRNLAVPAVLFLESSKPLSFIGSQMMHVFSPIFNSVFTGKKDFDRLAFLMEDRDNIERLLQVIEKKQEEFDDKKRQKKNSSGK